MATKIKDDLELQVSREAVERLQRALKGYEVANASPDCLESFRLMITKIEREIEGYLAEQRCEKTPVQTTSTQPDDLPVSMPMQELTTE